MFRSIIAISTLLVVAIPAFAKSGPPTRLRVEYLTNPIGLDIDRPRLSWNLNDDRRGARQTAYELRVATSESALKAARSEKVWGSGQQNTDQSVNVVYAGPFLRPRTRYFWTVRVWDQDGKATGWSPPAYWETGLMSRGAWTASWIGRMDSSASLPTNESLAGVKWIWTREAEGKDPPVGDRVFRHTFEVPSGKTVKSAYLYTSVDDRVTAFVNGDQVGDTAGWQSFACFPVKSQLKPGRNVVALKAHNDQGPAGLAAILRVNYDNGSERWITGAGKWKCFSNPVANATSGESIDSYWPDAIVVHNMGDAPWNTPSLSSPDESDRSAAMLRRAFLLDHSVKSARLYVTALGSYRIHINGKRVGEDILTPEWTDYRKRVNYLTYDVTKLLNRGENAIGAMLGDGWYGSGLGWTLKRYNFGAPPNRLLAQLQVTLADGTERVIVTDERWKVAKSPILRSEIYAGETYDSRLEQPGWDTVKFDDSSWRSAAVIPTPPTLIMAQSSPNVHVTKELKPVKLTQPKPGVWVYDMGQNMVGWVRLIPQGKPGDSIRLRFAERLNPDGTIYTENLRKAEATDTYTCGNSPAASWEPQFTFHGFQYVELTGSSEPPTLATITGRVFHSDIPFIGKVETSSALVNQIQHNIEWGARGNHLSVPTDCPQRDERLGWMGDAGIFARTATFNLQMSPFYSKWMRDVVDAQSAEGGFSDVSPRVIDESDGAPAWGDAGVIVPYEVWRQHNDTRIVEENWPAMERWFNYILKQNPNHLWLKRRNNDFGDWVPANSTSPKEVLATAYWAQDAMMLSQMATALGRSEDSKRYADHYAAIKDAFIKAFVKPDGTVGNGSQTCQALAIHMALLPENMESKAADVLVKDILDRGNHLSTGFLGTCFLMRALSMAGKVQTAYTLLLNTTYPSWGYTISKGATTIWERWNGDSGDPGMNSFNHYAFGAVGEWMYRNMAGIDTAKNGFKEIVIRPTLDDRLTHVRAEYDSEYGKIVSEWTRESPDARLTVNVTVPPNTTATVILPIRGGTVTESGKPITNGTGIELLSSAPGQPVYRVQPGTYHFAVK